MQANARRKELLAQNNASPLPTIIMPIVTQLPLFVGTSMVLSRASAMPTVLDSESFFTLTSLAHADSTMTLPILLGVITLANAESARWFVSAEVLQREQKVEKWTAERRARGEQILEPRKIYQTSLRILSVGRILIAAMVPGVSRPAAAARVCRNMVGSRVLSVSAEHTAVLGHVGDVWPVANVGIGLLGHAAP